MIKTTWIKKKKKKKKKKQTNPHEEVVGAGRRVPDAEYFHQIPELTVQVATDGDWRLQLQDIV
jgi:hypothetical protein